MANDNGLINELDKIQSAKKELEAKEEELKSKIVELAKQKNAEILFGTHKKCYIKSYIKVIYPEDKTRLIELVKTKGIYDSFSHINYPKLSSAITKKDVDPEIIDMVKQEKEFKVSIKEL